MVEAKWRARKQKLRGWYSRTMLTGWGEEGLHPGGRSTVHGCIKVSNPQQRQGIWWSSGRANFERLVTQKPCKTQTRACARQDRTRKRRTKGCEGRLVRYQTFKKCGHICNFPRKVTLWSTSAEPRGSLNFHRIPNFSCSIAFKAVEWIFQPVPFTYQAIARHWHHVTWAANALNALTYNWVEAVHASQGFDITR